MLSCPDDSNSTITDYYLSPTRGKRKAPESDDLPVKPENGSGNGDGSGAGSDGSSHGDGINPTSIDLTADSLAHLVGDTIEPTILVGSSQWAKNFTIKFSRGQVLLDSNNLLLLLNSSSKCNCICKLIQERANIYLTMTITSNASGHLSKCKIQCSLLDTDQKPIRIENTNDAKPVVLSRFAVDFKTVSNLFANVDRQKETIISRKDTKFTIDYEIQDDQCGDLGFDEVDVEEKVFDGDWAVKYHYQMSVAPSKLKRFFDPANKIENSIVNLRIYEIANRVRVLKLELDNIESQYKQPCDHYIWTDLRQSMTETSGFNDDDKDDAEAKVQDAKYSTKFIKEVCKDQANLIMIASFSKTNLMNISKISVPSLMMYLTLSPTPALFAYNTGEVEMYIYLGQFVSPALDAEIEYVKKKLEAKQRIENESETANEKVRNV